MVLEGLKEMRTNRGMTYKEVAEKANMTKEYYWMIENGKRNLSYPNAVLIAKVFNKTPDDIFLHSELTKTELHSK